VTEHTIIFLCPISGIRLFLEKNKLMKVCCKVKLGLNLSKYPRLMNLRSEETSLKHSILATVRDLLKSESIRSKLARNPDGSIPDDIIEIDGRYEKLYACNKFEQ